MFHVDPRGPESYQGQENRKRGRKQAKCCGDIFIWTISFPPSLWTVSHILIFGMGVLSRRRRGSWWWGQRVLGRVPALGGPAWSTENPWGSAKRLKLGGHVSFSSPADCGDHSSRSGEQQPSSQAFLRQQQSRLSTHVVRASLCPWQGNGAHSTELGSLLAHTLDLISVKYKIDACFLYSKSK